MFKTTQLLLLLAILGALCANQPLVALLFIAGTGALNWVHGYRINKEFLSVHLQLERALVSSIERARGNQQFMQPVATILPIILHISRASDPTSKLWLAKLALEIHQTHSTRLQHQLVAKKALLTLQSHPTDQYVEINLGHCFAEKGEQVQRLLKEQGQRVLLTLNSRGETLLVRPRPITDPQTLELLAKQKKR